MKTILTGFAMLGLLSVNVFASGNCAMHDRGSDSWNRCEEWYADQEVHNARIREDFRDLRANTDAAILADTQNEQNAILLRAILDAQARRAEGK